MNELCFFFCDIARYNGSSFSKSETCNWINSIVNSVNIVGQNKSQSQWIYMNIQENSNYSNFNSIYTLYTHTKYWKWTGIEKLKWMTWHIERSRSDRVKGLVSSTVAMNRKHSSCSYKILLDSNNWPCFYLVFSYKTRDYSDNYRICEFFFCLLSTHILLWGWVW